jgi:uncharacterized protein (TIGR03435 family)
VARNEPAVGQAETRVGPDDSLKPLWSISSVVPFRPARGFGQVSIRRNVSGRTESRFSLETFAGPFSATNVTVAELVGWAYYTKNLESLAGPAWVRIDRFDITALSPFVGVMNKNEFRTMLRTLLEERFGLSVRLELRDVPMFRLVMANPDGRLGDLMRHADDECTSLTLLAIAPAGANGGTGCATVGYIASKLARELGVPVLDDTHLDGQWNHAFVWTPAPGELIEPRSPVPETMLRLLLPNPPPFMVALREQLGFALEATHGLAEIVVIDSVQQPTLD